MGVTQYARLVAPAAAAAGRDVTVTACCPGLCRTGRYMTKLVVYVLPTHAHAHTPSLPRAHALSLSITHPHTLTHTRTHTHTDMTGGARYKSPVSFLFWVATWLPGVGQSAHQVALSQKRPIYVSKETYLHVKRDLFTCQKRPIYMWTKRAPGSQHV